jgi:hypothetical protein
MNTIIFYASEEFQIISNDRSRFLKLKPNTNQMTGIDNDFFNFLTDS